MRLTEPDPFAWPEDTRIATLRAARDAYRDHYFAVCDELREANDAHDAMGADLATATARLADIAALVVHREAKDGLVPACQLRAALGMGPRRTKET